MAILARLAPQLRKSAHNIPGSADIFESKDNLGSLLTGSRRLAQKDHGIATEDIARILGITIEMAKHYSDRAARRSTASAAVVVLGEIGKRTP